MCYQQLFITAKVIKLPFSQLPLALNGGRDLRPIYTN